MKRCIQDYSRNDVLPLDSYINTAVEYDIKSDKYFTANGFAHNYAKNDYCRCYFGNDCISIHIVLKVLPNETLNKITKKAIKISNVIYFNLMGL